MDNLVNDALNNRIYIVASPVNLQTFVSLSNLLDIF